MTADELLRLPDDGSRHELIEGELRSMTPAGFRHGAIVMKLSRPLEEHVATNRLGLVAGAETGFKLKADPDTVRAPDIAFVSRERVEVEGVPDTFWPGPPDLAVEVLLPSDTVYDVEDKVATWLACGTRLVWVVHPKRRVVIVHRPGEPDVTLSEADTLDGGDVIPGFGFRVEDIFHEL
jgi:Uma2 family endonuclease